MQCKAHFESISWCDLCHPAQRLAGNFPIVEDSRLSVA